MKSFRNEVQYKTYVFVKMVKTKYVLSYLYDTEGFPKNTYFGFV